MTQNEAFALAERVTGRNIDTVNVSVEQVLGVVKHDEDVRTRHWMEYAYSMWIRGDNTVENEEAGVWWCSRCKRAISGYRQGAEASARCREGTAFVLKQVF